MLNDHASRPAKWLERTLAAVLLLTFTLVAFSDDKKSPEKNKSVKPPLPVQHSLSDEDLPLLEVLCSDGSILKLAVLDEYVPFRTPYGKLVIPMADIHRIEFATRIPEEVDHRILVSIGNLGRDVFQVRDAASKRLLKIGPKTYSALLLAKKSKDLEVSKRAVKVIEKLRDTFSEELLVVRDHDVIHTADSKISGRIEIESFNIITAQFGNQKLKLLDMHNLRSPNAAELEPKNVLGDPGTLGKYQSFVGKTFAFRVTGANQQGAVARGGWIALGTVWGTDKFTLDSMLALAAIHAGILKPGETKIVKIKILGAQQTFKGSTRNGVTSRGFPGYPGAYQFVK